MTDAELQSEWDDLVDDVENGLIQNPFPDWKAFVSQAAEKIVGSPSCGIGTQETKERRRQAIEQILTETLTRHRP